MKAAYQIEVLAEYKLPVPISREIGRVVVHYSHYEHLLQRCIWNLLRLSQAQGRIAVREPRAEDRLDMIRDLALLRNLPMDASLLLSLRTRTRELKAERDLLAHGVWGFVPIDGSWNVQLTRGAWEDVAPNAPMGSRTIEPELKTRTADHLRGTTSQIEKLIEDFKTLTNQLFPDMPPWPGIRVSRHANRTPTTNQGSSKLQPQPRPSPAARRKAAMEREKK